MKTDKQQNEVEVSSLKSTPIDCALQGHNKSITPTEANPEHHGAKMSVPSGSPLGSTATTSPGLRGSPASPREDAGAASVVGPNSSHGRLSSCSTVKITEEQLKLNPVKPEVGRGGTKNQLLWAVSKPTLLSNPPAAQADPAAGTRGEPGAGNFTAGPAGRKSKAGRGKEEEGKAGSGEEAEGGEDEE